jgi:hypothetical protein
MAKYEPFVCDGWKRKTLEQIAAGETELNELRKQLCEYLSNINILAVEDPIANVLKALASAKDEISARGFS